MELIYLWVEDYKNIHKQGFNFSGQYRCEYDDVKNELTINENREYVHIFPENINVTAIVGKNGSGKSSLLEFLKIITGYEAKDKNFILIFKNLKGVLKYKSNLKLNTEISIDNFPCNVLNYYEDISYHSLKNEFYFENKIELKESSIIENIILNNFNKNFELSSFMYIPNKLIIPPQRDKIDKLFKQVLINNSRVEEEEKKSQISDILNINSKYHKFLILQCIENDFNMRGLMLSNNITGLHIDNIQDLNIFKNIELLEESFNNEPINLEEIFNIYFMRNTNITTSVDELDDNEKKIYIRYYQYFENFYLLDSKDRSYNMLSHGEKKLFGILLNIYSFSQSQKCGLFLLDEPDLTLHPNWQKEYIKEIVSLLQKLNKRIHIITSSHSPFILSDLPKENVVFFRKW